MIIDHVRNASLYRGVTKRIALAFDFISRTDLAGLADGKQALDGDNVFALIQSYNTNPIEKGLWEAHKKYIDVQFVVSGIELMGHVDIAQMTVSKAYDDKDDYHLLTGKGNHMIMHAGDFTVFFPQDVHMPCMAVDNKPAPVKKVVVKVRVD
jgi:YhcH/YjgK/YiaL family protein